MKSYARQSVMLNWIIGSLLAIAAITLAMIITL